MPARGGDSQAEAAAVVGCSERDVSERARRPRVSRTALAERANGGDGPVLREARIAAGVTQRAVAAVLGVTASTLCDLELGHHQFRGLAERYRKWADDGFPIGDDQKPLAAT